METKQTKYKIPEEVALADVKDFVEFHKEKDYTDEKVNEDYDDLVEAVKLGLLVFDDNKVPTYILKKPVLTVAGGTALDKIVCKTRIRASEKENLSKGLTEKEGGKMLNLMKAFFIQQPKAMLDKFDSKFDERVIDQLCHVFM